MAIRVSGPEAGRALGERQHLAPVTAGSVTSGSFLGFKSLPVSPGTKPDLLMVSEVLLQELPARGHTPGQSNRVGTMRFSNAPNPSFARICALVIPFFLNSLSLGQVCLSPLKGLP